MKSILVFIMGLSPFKKPNKKVMIFIKWYSTTNCIIFSERIDEIYEIEPYLEHNTSSSIKKVLSYLTDEQSMQNPSDLTSLNNKLSSFNLKFLQNGMLKTSGFLNLLCIKSPIQFSD